MKREYNVFTIQFHYLYNKMEYSLPSEPVPEYYHEIDF